jgi:hypothetical protein
MMDTEHVNGNMCFDILPREAEVGPEPCTSISLLFLTVIFIVH